MVKYIVRKYYPNASGPYLQTYDIIPSYKLIIINISQIVLKFPILSDSYIQIKLF